jgi:hypothetical protein
MIAAIAYIATSNRIADALPLVIYTPATGNLRLVNDGKYSRGMDDITDRFYFTSTSGSFKLPTISPPVGMSYLPHALELRDVGIGTFNLFGAVTPWTPLSDLAASKSTPIGRPETVLISVPEPTAAATALSIFTGAIVLLRRRK